MARQVEVEMLKNGALKAKKKKRGASCLAAPLACTHFFNLSPLNVYHLEKLIESVIKREEKHILTGIEYTNSINQAIVLAKAVTNYQCWLP